MIDILLATRNSAPFLREQLDSLLAQTFTAWRLLAHDGGSRDDTVAILKEYAAKDGRIRFLGGAPLSALGNFSHLWRQTTADYVMFCDHDDVWLPDKIAYEMEAMRVAETETPGLPVLVFSDAAVTDTHLTVRATSSLRWQGLDPKRRALRQLLVQNVAAGNTMLLNRALWVRCGEIPSKAVMHDHWVSLVAAIFGRTLFLPRPTLLYRQHQSNVFGAASFPFGILSKRAKQGVRGLRARFWQNVSQGQALLARFSGELPERESLILQAFANLPDQSWLLRRWTLLRHGFLKCGICRNLGTLLIL